eukprot:g3279.t1
MSKTFSKRGRIALIVILASVICLSGTVQKASQLHGRFAYSVVTVTLWSELLKLIVSIFLSLRNAWSSGTSILKGFTSPWEWAIFIPPALLYALWNNMNYVVLIYLDPATMSLVHNLKIFFTAGFMRWILKKRFTIQQWISVTGLVFGVVFSQLSHLSPNTDADQEAQSWIIGITLGASRALGTAATNVYTEWAFKRNAKESIHVENVMLYFWGIIVNILALYFMGNFDTVLSFKGYNGWVALSILCSGTGGLLISFVFKYVDNVALLVADIVGLIGLITVSFFFFGLLIDSLFLVGVFIIGLSLYGYYGPALQGMEKYDDYCESVLSLIFGPAKSKKRKIPNDLQVDCKYEMVPVDQSDSVAEGKVINLSPRSRPSF